MEGETVKNILKKRGRESKEYKKKKRNKIDIIIIIISKRERKTRIKLTNK